MNFSVDDPLADLLSDNSIDNDSFFDNPSGGAGKRSRNATNKAKGRIEDLFGIKEESEPEVRPLSSRRQANANTTDSTKMHAIGTPRITRQETSQSNDNKDDDDDLGFDPKKPKSGSKLNLFDDLLVPADTKRPSTAAAAVFRREETGKPTMSRQSTDTNSESSNLLASQVRPRTAAGRRSSGNSGVAFSDSLGLFGTRTKEKEPGAAASDRSSPKTVRRSTTADWLGLSAAPEESSAKPDISQESPKTARPTKVENVDILKIPETDADADDVHDSAGLPVSKTTQGVMLLNSMNLENRNALAAMRQQESQLSMAAQMKSQERGLLELQRKQDSVLLAQEQQFETLLQQQIQRQQQLETYLKAQQQRINTHLQLLMSQPALAATLPELAAPGQTERDESMQKNEQQQQQQQQQRTATVGENAQMELELKRLDTERERMMDLVETTKNNYESEIAMIESSYKRQLKLAEEHLSNVEGRLKAELDSLSLFYTEKLEMFESEKSKQRAASENEITELKQNYEAEIKKLKKSHDDDLDMLKEDQRRMIENIRQAKMLEFAAMQENGNYLGLLKSASINLENLSDGLQSLRADMQGKIEALNMEKEKQLEAREQKLESAERRLKMQEESSEAEKKRLMELVSSLELQLGTLQKEAGEESWLMRQQMANLSAEKKAFEREKEFSRDILMRDEKRIADLKEEQLAEKERIMLELQEERAGLLLERSKLETQKKLLQQKWTNGTQHDTEASLKVAQEAADRAEAERERYYRMQRQSEQLKRELSEKKEQLHAEQSELEKRMTSLRLAERKAQMALQKSQETEQTYLAKMQQLQQRFTELGEKEANLSHERSLLSQERIMLHTLNEKLRQRDCPLCRIYEQREQTARSLQQIGSGFREPSAAAVNDVRESPSALANTPATATPAAGNPKETNIVDQMLDRSIAESFRTMKTTTAGQAEYWTECVLDDDTKELALHRLDKEK